MYDMYPDVCYGAVAKTSESLLRKAVFAWDMDLLIRIIKGSGGGISGESNDYYMSATRLILDGNRVIRRDEVWFDMAMLWCLEGDKVWRYLKFHEWS